MIKLKSRIILLMVLSTLIACVDSADIVSKDLSQGWHHNDDIVLSLKDKITAEQESIDLVINHSSEFTYQNLYIILSLISENQQTRDTMDIILSDDKGYWKGDCNGPSCSYRYTQLITKPLAPIKQIHIEQYSRDSILMGINTVGIRY